MTLTMPFSSFESTAGRRQYFASLSNIAPGEAGLATSRWSYRNPPGTLSTFQFRLDSRRQWDSNKRITRKR